MLKFMVFSELRHESRDGENENIKGEIVTQGETKSVKAIYRNQGRLFGCWSKGVVYDCIDQSLFWTEIQEQIGMFLGGSRIQESSLQQRIKLYCSWSQTRKRSIKWVDKGGSKQTRLSQIMAKKAFSFICGQKVFYRPLEIVVVQANRSSHKVPKQPQECQNRC